MKKIRAVLTGAFVWVLIFTAFIGLGFVPIFKDSLNMQALIVSLLAIPFALFAASMYYKNGNKDKGLNLGIIMVITGLTLDALITIPFVEIPNGGSYQSFYSYPLLWLIVGVNLITVYFYWKLKVNG